jgi:hypothetical protein
MFTTEGPTWSTKSVKSGNARTWAQPTVGVKTTSILVAIASTTSIALTGLIVVKFIVLTRLSKK